MSDDPREYSLPSILSSKHYPQVLRVARPYYAHGHEYLKKGQYITVLDRRKVELIAGLDYDRRAFRIRKDRSAQVEVIEEERIVYNLAVVVEIERHITAIEFRKEIRHEKQTFEAGEKFTIEKVVKNFRGRSKHVALRRKRDGKVYRFPLDLIGTFRLLAGKSILPVSKVLTLRMTPVTARFTNTSKLENFPTGIVTLGDSVLCDVVYILTVTNDVYQYEAITVDSNIIVEKCNLIIPKPILEVIPNGVFVNSAEYLQSIKAQYKRMISGIDSKLVEDIYAQMYYGSASFDKKPEYDSHLVARPRIASSTKSFDELQTEEFIRNKSPTASTSSDEPPTPFPRYSKKSNYRNTISFPAIKEHEQLEKRMEETFTRPISLAMPKTTMDCGTSMNDTVGRKILADYIRSDSIDSQQSLPVVLSGSQRSKNSSIRSSSSDYLERQGIAESAAQIFYNPSNIGRRHSRSSSTATVYSYDSGVMLTHPFSSATSSSLSSPTEEKNSLYAFPIKTNSATNVRKITMPPPASNTAHALAPIQPPPPLPPRESLYQNIHHVQVDIDISETAYSDYDDVRNSEMVYSDYDDARNEHHIDDSIRSGNFNDTINRRIGSREPTYEELPYENIDPFDFRSHSVVALKPRDRKAVAERLSKHFAESAAHPVSHNTMEIQSLTQEEVSHLLARLNLSKYIRIFNNELINGQLLQDLDEKTLTNDLEMTHFQSRKLYKYILGWRPQISDINENSISSITLASNPLHWSVDDVFNELQKINLQNLAIFCKDQQVDGNLLKDIVGNNIISSLRNEHGVTMSGIEMSRLKAFVLKEWRPDNFQGDSVPNSINNKVDRSNINDKKERQSIKKSIPIWNKIMGQSNGST